MDFSRSLGIMVSNMKPTEQGLYLHINGILQFPKSFLYQFIDHSYMYFLPEYKKKEANKFFWDCIFKPDGSVTHDPAEKSQFICNIF